MPILRRMPVASHVVNVETPQTRHNADAARLLSESLALDVEKLYMITEALWTIVKKQNNITDDHLLELIKGIDMRSGKLDGRRKKEVRPDCQQCGRKMISKSTICLYCGTVAKLDPFKKY